MLSNATYRLLKKPFFGRYQKRPWSWPAEVDDAAWDRVRFASESGAMLSGAFGPALGTMSKGGVVLAHPMGAAAKGFFLKNGVGEMLREAGYDVLSFDFNGFGESQSGNFDYPSDVVAAGNYLKARRRGERVFALGVSFGAAWVACALSRPEQPFRAAVLESGFARLEEYWSRKPLAYAVLRAISLARPSLAAALRPIERISEMNDVESVLLVYGSADDVTPVSVGERMLERVRGAGKPAAQVDLWVVDGAQHMKTYQTAPSAYRERVLNLFESDSTRSQRLRASSHSASGARS